MFDFDPEEQYFALMDSVTETGHAARLSGATIYDCPHEDHRLVSAWKTGWRRADRECAAVRPE